jgi:hypothetical protein
LNFLLNVEFKYLRRRENALYCATFHLKVTDDSNFLLVVAAMTLLTRYDTPANLPDFDSIPGQREAWHKAVSTWFDETIFDDSQDTHDKPLVYYNAANFDPGGAVVEQEITWNAFPKTLLRQYGRDRALYLADRLWPLESYRLMPPAPDDVRGTKGILYRPHDEYCEWRVSRDARTGKISKVAFTSEPPEYWQALFGYVPGSSDPPIRDQSFPGDKEKLLQLYRELVSPEVQIEDLIAATDLGEDTSGVSVKKGQYNPYNKWNTVMGIVHLIAPPNSLLAEIKLGADASIRYVDSDGRTIIEPEALITFAAYGGINRNSDPTIGATVNALTRIGAYVTLRNPVGLYMDHIDLAGWETPDNSSPEQYVRIIRGQPGMVERLEVAVPPERDFSLEDITIAGVPIQYGGQIAECITVKLVGVANLVPNRPPVPVIKTTNRGLLDPEWPLAVRRPSRSGPALNGMVDVYVGEGREEKEVADELIASASPLVSPRPERHHRRRLRF